MGYAYTNNGLSWRAWDDPNDLQAGEVYFAARATPDQLSAAFPSYNEAKATYELNQQARAALRQGLSIKCKSNPGINGTYAIDDSSLARINAVSTYIMVNSKFPAGVTSFPINDISGEAHLFSDTALFQVWASAIADYIATLHMILVNGTGSLPSSTVVLA